MPKNDYDDPELTFPRLEARIRLLDSETYWLQVWFHKEPGAPREVLTNGKRRQRVGCPRAFEEIEGLNQRPLRSGRLLPLRTQKFQTDTLPFFASRTKALFC